MSSLQHPKAFRMEWFADAILPNAFITLSDSISLHLLRRRLINVPYTGLQEEVVVRSTRFLSPSALIAHLGVMLVQPVDDSRVNVLREFVYIIFLQARDFNLSVQVLDSFNTEEIYERKPNRAPLSVFRHRFTYNFAVEDWKHQNRTYLKVNIRGRVWLRLPNRWILNPKRAFRDKERILMSVDPEEQVFRLIR